MTDNEAEKKWRKGGCHCGAVAIEVRAADNLKVTYCNCSMCSKAGYLHLIVDADDFRVLQGADNLTTYTFNTGTAKHTFCKTCGIKSYYVPRSHPDGYSVNVNCLNMAEFDSITVEDFDGLHWEENIHEL